MDKKYPVIADEELRIEALNGYEIVDTPPEAEFDHIAQLAADLFHVPTALISFVQSDRQFFKAKVGFDACETTRDVSFCAHALVGDDVLVVPDALQDTRFRDNPLVTAAPFIRFYAGAPLATPAGRKIGSICVIDTVARPPLSDHEKGLLQSLARLTMDHLEQRRLNLIKRGALRMAAATPDAIVCFGNDERITFWNQAAERIFGHRRSEAMGRPISFLIPADHQAEHVVRMRGFSTVGHRHLAGKTLDTFGLRMDGSLIPIELSLAAWGDGPSLQFGAIIRDVSERRDAQQRLQHVTHFDRLTGLPNRVRFLELVEGALTSAQVFSILKIGLDGFKSVNGSLGMGAGDAVLKAAAGRVVAAAGEESFVAHLGADEFGILIRGDDGEAAATLVGERVLISLNEPFRVQGSTCHLSASIGIVLCEGTSDVPGADVILKRGLLALQSAKRAGGRRSELFRPELGEKAEARRQLEEELRRAFERDEFELHFQPQVRLTDYVIVGAEALLRWNHPDRGFLSPAAFLPVLETSDIAVAVGRWIMQAACSFAAELSASGYPVRMGVNLFAAQLRDEELLPHVVQMLADLRLPASLLELEITETTVLSLDDAAIPPLRSLQEAGVGIAFDDYGTGFASLSLLKRYPLSRLKIDREFVRDLETDSDDAAIVKAVLALGGSLGLEVIAEGIETAEQAEMLNGFGCKEAQGYRFGKPMPALDFKKMLSSQKLSRAA